MLGSTTAELERHARTLAAILWNHGADVEGPFLDHHDGGAVVLRLAAHLPGRAAPRPAEIVVNEIWESTPGHRFLRTGYAYDLIDHPASRRRAFHAHDQDRLLHEFDVVAHEHCEETLGAPISGHYFGFPVDAYEAIRGLAIAWSQPGPLGCDDLRCMT